MYTLIKNITEKIIQHRRFSKTYDELNKLNNRELADIGVNRCDIARIARRSAKD